MTSTNRGRATHPLRELASFGQSPWLDVIDRELLESGKLERLIDDGCVTGVTSNPAIFEQAITATSAYEADVERLVRAGSQVAQIYETLALADVRDAADLLRGVYEESDGRDGFVSFEVSPQLARDTRQTIEEARRIWAAIDRPNAMIKVPGTSEGLSAATALLAAGINVNVTLLFSIAQYETVLRAHADGLRAALDTSKRVDRIASVASFFLSRIDTVIDREIDDRSKGTGDAAALLALRGEAAIASARCAYGVFERFSAGEAFRRLADRGARRQRLLWASTGTKDPRYSPIKYVEPLVGADTVNTMPLATLEAYRASGRPSRRLPDEAAQGPTLLAALEQAGIDLERATTELLEEGIDKFAAAHERLLGALESAAAGRESALERTR